ncbi:EthD domain-containing protein [Xylariaceae sp. FL1651]|nr:EthD domain-containing protein [Xylariaceae sp. FL1651]
MTYSILVFLYRKLGTTPQQFKAYYNDSHLPFFRELAGPHNPVLHTQRYIHRSEIQAEGNTDRNPLTPATVFLGSQADFDYDVVVDVKFKDAMAFQEFHKHMQQPEIAARIAADEEHFLDRTQTRVAVLGETIEIVGE